jgi:NAD(P)H-dependent FMN reductase
MNKIKILAIPGSLRANSSSSLILKNMTGMFPADVVVSVYESTGKLPHFNDSNEAPPEVQDLRSQIANADGIIICQPEYAFGVAGSLKNALDWIVGSGELVGKPVALVTAATGGENAHAALKLTLTAMDASLVTASSCVISFVKSKLDGDGKIKDAETEKQLKTGADHFLRHLTERVKNNKAAASL